MIDALSFYFTIFQIPFIFKNLLIALGKISLITIYLYFELLILSSILLLLSSIASIYRIAVLGYHGYLIYRD